MSLQFPDGISSPLDQQLFLAEKRFQDALRADAEFAVLKKIRIEINALKAQINEKGAQTFHNDSNVHYQQPQ